MLALAYLFRSPSDILPSQEFRSHLIATLRLSMLLLAFGGKMQLQTAGPTGWMDTPQLSTACEVLNMKLLSAGWGIMDGRESEGMMW